MGREKFDFNSSHNIESAEAIVHAELIDLFRTATFAPNRAISDETTGIRLGAFEAEAHDLLKIASSENHATEKGRYVIVLPNGRVVIQREDVTETNTHSLTARLKVRFHPLPHLVSKRERQNRFLGTIMHTHPIDVCPFTN